MTVPLNVTMDEVEKRFILAVYEKARHNKTAAAKMLGLGPQCCNPYMNSVAQVVEAVEVVEAALEQGAAEVEMIALEQWGEMPLTP